MRVTRPIKGTVWALSALAGLCLVERPALASEAPGSAPSAKSDKLSVTPLKGDLLNRKPDRARPERPAVAIKPAFTSRGSVAARLIDVAVRDDGIWLNSFATRSMPLEALACAEIGEEIVSSLALPVGAVQRLAEEELMRQTRVCAVNGSLLITCYGGGATVSLRRPQRGDGCGG